MAPLKLKGRPPYPLYVGTGVHSPKPVLVASAKAIPGKDLGDQLGAYAATVIASLQAALPRLSDGPQGKPFYGRLEESGLLCTRHGFLLAKFTVLDPDLLKSFTELTLTSTLLPLQQPNPGFADVRLSWENHVVKTYRVLKGVPVDMSPEALVVFINQTIPCRYVGPHEGASGLPITGQYVVAFSANSATDIPSEISVPARGDTQKGPTIRVLHAPELTSAVAAELRSSPSKWRAAPVGSPSPSDPPSAASSKAKAPPAPSPAAPASGKKGKPSKTGLDAVAQRRVEQNTAKLQSFAAKEKALARADKTIARRVVRNALNNIKAREQRALEFAQYKANCVVAAAAATTAATADATAASAAATAEQIAARAAVKAAAVAAARKRQHESSDDDAVGVDLEILADVEDSSDKPDQKKAKEHVPPDVGVATEGPPAPMEA